MATTKIWNISDGPNPDVTPQNVMVMGKLLKPGHALTIEEEKLKTAHKVKKEAATGILHIGKKAPADYLRLKHPEHRKLAAGVGRSQGERPVSAPEPTPPVVEEEVWPRGAEPEAAAEDPSPPEGGGEGGGGGMGRRKRRRG